MNGHDEFLELVAASIDFELTDEEFGRLSTHLARCPDCRRAAEEIRGGAAAIAALPAPVLAPARAEQILRGALRTPPAKPRWGLLAVAAMLATLGGGILFAGFQLVNDDDSTPSEPPPSLVAEASTPPSAEPSGEESLDPGDGAVDGPFVTPTPGEPTPTPDPAVLRFPIPYARDLGFVRVAPAPDDRLWVAFNRDRDTLLALLDGGGAPVDGWPAIVPNAGDCLPLAAPDGSVRLLCYYSTEPGECVDVCGEDRAFAFAPNGEQLGGFPVSFPSGFASGVDRFGARMVGDSIVLTGYEGSDDGESGGSNDRWIVEVRSNGNVVLGARVPAAQQCCVHGPDGIAYGTSVFYPDDTDLHQTQVLAFDAHGMRSGWPIVVDGTASPPSFGPNGQLVLSAWADTESLIVRRNPDGSEAAPPIHVPQSITWSPDGADGPLPPLVDERGRMWATSGEEILGFDQDGASLAGFPYDPETGLVMRGGDCGEQDTGCQSWVAPPQLAPQSLIYTLEKAPEGKGERLNVVNRDGSIRSGWPNTLKRTGAAWESVTIGSNRVAYAVANEPEADGEASVTIVAYAPNGTVTWKLTLIEP